MEREHAGEPHVSPTEPTPGNSRQCSKYQCDQCGAEEHDTHATRSCIGNGVCGEENETEESCPHRRGAREAMCRTVDDDVLESHARKPAEGEELKGNVESIDETEPECDTGEEHHGPWGRRE